MGGVASTIADDVATHISRVTHQVTPTQNTHIRTYTSRQTDATHTQSHTRARKPRARRDLPAPPEPEVAGITQDLSTVKEGGIVLGRRAATLSDDPETVLAAVRRVPRALALADTRHRADPRIVMAAVQEDGCVLQFADPALRRDPRVCRAAVGQCGQALRFAAPECQADAEVVLAAVAVGETVILLINTPSFADTPLHPY